jgi:hypothetical protein
MAQQAQYRPSGPISIDAVVLKVQNVSSEGTSGMVNWSILVDLLAKDPYTGDIVSLPGVKFRQVSAIPETVDIDTLCTLHGTYEQFSRRDILSLSAVIKPSDPVVQNQAIPIKVKDDLDSFSVRGNSTCKKFSELEQATKKNMGILTDRNDITLFQGRSNGRSPGMLIHQNDGKLILFDNSGKQTITMDGQQVGVKASSFDTGNAKREHSSLAIGGLAAEDNPVADVLPQGPIVSPHPKTIPSITKILNTITPILDIVDLVSACAKAVKAVQSMYSTGSTSGVSSAYKSATRTSTAASVLGGEDV